MFVPLCRNRCVEPRRPSTGDGFRVRGDGSYTEEERSVRGFDGIVEEADGSG